MPSKMGWGLKIVKNLSPSGLTPRVTEQHPGPLVDNYMSLSSIFYFTSYIFLLLRLWQLKILSLELQVA